MKIAIEIPDKIYDGIKKRFPGDLCYMDVFVMAKAIMNGTILPKGHGRLIDADELEECKEIMNTISGESKYAVRMDDVRLVPTIIEADKVCTYKETGCGSCRWQIECPYDEADKEGAEECGN